MERHILVDSNNVVVGIVEGNSFLDLLNSGIEYWTSYPLTDVEPNIGDVYNP